MSEISDLFAADPLSLTKEDRSKIILHMRENRVKFLSGVKAEKTPKPKAEPKAKPGKLSLDDLGI